MVLLCKSFGGGSAGVPERAWHSVLTFVLKRVLDLELEETVSVPRPGQCCLTPENKPRNTYPEGMHAKLKSAWHFSVVLRGLMA